MAIIGLLLFLFLVALLVVSAALYVRRDADEAPEPNALPLSTLHEEIRAAVAEGGAEMGDRLERIETRLAELETRLKRAEPEQRDRDRA